MDRADLISQVNGLRALGLTPKQIARRLGLRPAQVEPIIRASAKQGGVAVEPPLVGCWVTPGWSRGLRFPHRAGWRDPAPDDDDPFPSLVLVLVARERRYGKISICSFLVDAQCLGVKNVIGPRVLHRDSLSEFLELMSRGHAGRLEAAPLDLACELVLGAVEYAGRLGFSPHPDFDACRGHLGPWTGPSAIEFGCRGKPLFVAGPDDDVGRIIGMLERSVGAGNFDFVAPVG